MSLPVRRRRARPLTLAGVSQKLRQAQTRVAELEQSLEAEKADIRHLQRTIWRLEQELGPEVSNDEIDADRLFRIRFPSHTTV